MTDEFTTRLLVRAADLRDKFVDGRASAFKRDFPGWFAAFTEVLGFLTEAAARIRDSDRERDAALARVGDVDRYASRLREALLWRYDGELSNGCEICRCTWEAGTDEQHDADCMARPELIRAATGGDDSPERTE